MRHPPKSLRWQWSDWTVHWHRIWKVKLLGAAGLGGKLHVITFQCCRAVGKASIIETHGSNDMTHWTFGEVTLMSRAIASISSLAKSSATSAHRLVTAVLSSLLSKEALGDPKETHGQGAHKMGLFVSWYLNFTHHITMNFVNRMYSEDNIHNITNIPWVHAAYSGRGERLLGYQWSSLQLSSFSTAVVEEHQTFAESFRPRA